MAGRCSARRTSSGATLLEGLGIDAATWRVPPGFDGHGADVLAASRENQLEGVVAKRADSTYRPGARSPDWRKVKHVRMQEVVVAGWRTGHGRREGGIGSLHPRRAGRRRDLEFAGGVGTGFTGRDARRPGRAGWLRWHRRDLPVRRAAATGGAREAHWVEPVLVGEVLFTRVDLRRPAAAPLLARAPPGQAPGEVRRE